MDIERACFIESIAKEISDNINEHGIGFIDLIKDNFDESDSEIIEMFDNLKLKLVSEED